MSTKPHGGHVDREAMRAVLQDALADLPTAADPDAAARDVMRALDAYMDSGGLHPERIPREPPVTDFSRQLQQRDDSKKWTLWFVMGAAVVTTILVVAVLSGGWPAAIAVAAIWIAAILALTVAS